MCMMALPYVNAGLKDKRLIRQPDKIYLDRISSMELGISSTNTQTVAVVQAKLQRRSVSKSRIPKKMIASANPTL